MSGGATIECNFTAHFMICIAYCQILPGYAAKLAQVALRVPPEVAFAMRSWPLLIPTFSLSPFSPSFAFDPLRGNSRG